MIHPNLISIDLVNKINKSNAHIQAHSKLCSITPVAIKVHMILQSFRVLTWMRDTIESM